MLEREVSLIAPKQAVREKAAYVSANTEVKEKVSFLQKVSRIQLQMGVSEKTMIKLRRAQDLLSQKKKKNIDLEITLDELLENFLEKQDPVRKARRQKIRGSLKIDTELANTKSIHSEKVRLSKIKSSKASAKNHEKDSPKKTNNGTKNGGKDETKRGRAQQTGLVHKSPANSQMTVHAERICRQCDKNERAKTSSTSCESQASSLSS